MRRVCPRCDARCREDIDRDAVICPRHQRLAAWVVVDDGWRVVAAGRQLRADFGASWLHPTLADGWPAEPAAA